MTKAPANWYADPSQRHQLRYWDGAVWTHTVSDNGSVGVDPVMQAARPALDPAQDVRAVVAPSRRRSWFILSACAVAVLILFGVLLALTGGSSNDATVPLDAEQRSHAIQPQYFKNIPIGVPKARMIEALGKQPEDPQAYVDKGILHARDVDASCVYYNNASASFGSGFEFCFTKDALRSKKPF